MISNIYKHVELAGLARAKKLHYSTKTVPTARALGSQVDGWEVLSKNKSSVRVSKLKEPQVALEDRVWTLLYRLGFELLSGDGGATFALKRRDAADEHFNLGLFSANDEVCVLVKCVTATPRRAHIDGYLAEIHAVREALIKTIASTFPTDHKRQTVFLLVTSGVQFSAIDKAALDHAHVTVFDTQDVDYYEKLATHLGPAAKYQLLADILPGKTIPALTIRVPAVKTKMGGAYCYTFAISPEYLLKIAYVSHRSKGKASDVNTYQRMVTKARLATIREYIADDGVFPTNIVLNIDKNRLSFERVKQANSKVDEVESGTLGWLDIKPAYKSAWIIDGQHRLYAYSGHERASNSHLSVLAFEGLSASKQAQLFIDINAKQKSVKQSLLQELYAELHWDAADPLVRVRAIVSKAIQILDDDSSSPFSARIQTADSIRDNNRCISITSIFGALEKPGFFVSKERKGAVVTFGALWAGDNESTLNRTVMIVKTWFAPIAELGVEWWKLGAAEGGGLAMNDGVVACIDVLRSVIACLETDLQPLVAVADEKLVALLSPFASALAKYLSGLSPSARKQFRDFRGVQGITARTRRCQQAIREEIPTFCPAGLDEFIESEKHQTNAKAKTIIDNIERTLQKLTMEVLRGEFQDDWWVLGVPQGVRTAASDRFEKDDGKRGGREFYFDLIDYRKIAGEHWPLFENLLSDTKSGSKDKRTQWMVTVNEARKVVAHASSGKTLSLEELQTLQNVESRLTHSISSN
jgi:DNA sulfur modification protein DndB